MSGEWKLSVAGELLTGPQTFDVVNPATEEVFAQAPKADAGLLDVAVAAAEAAFAPWRTGAANSRSGSRNAVCDARSGALR